MAIKSGIHAFIKKIHVENGDPLDLHPRARAGIYDTRAAMFLPFIKGKDVLELGCGYGYNAFLFSKTANIVIAVDADKKAIAKASKRFSGVSNIVFIANDALVFLNETTKKFDVIVLFEFLEHLSIEEQVFLIKTLREKLKTDGQLFLSTPMGKYIPFYRKNPYHKRELTVEELVILLCSNHFRIEIIKGQVHLLWLFFPFPWGLIEKLWLYLGIYERMCVLRDNPSSSRTIIVKTAT
jgi:2-polyprenyl-3-methyl-5-hydroxy-6-metoxy-1,4-benzoquinol methylase